MPLLCVRASFPYTHSSSLFSFFFFNDPPTPEIYTLSLHDALPILSGRARLAPAATRATPPRRGPNAQRAGGGAPRRTPQPRRVLGVEPSRRDRRAPRWRLAP